MTVPLDLHIRVACERDAVVLRAVSQDTYESTWLPEMTPAAAQAFQDEDRPTAYVVSRGTKFWLAENSGEVVGFIDWHADFVNALHVRSGFGRRGIGRRLMDHAEAEIVKAGFTAARLETDTFNMRSRAFYEARGYREADRYPDTEWSSGFTTILFVKALH